MVFETRELLDYFERNNGHDLGTVAVFALGLFMRLCVGTGFYSGMNTPPMYGDFEAQRHWMEVTVNLPICDWYTQTPDNDLQYWGLDYPPLTAYHSWLVGKVAELLVPDMVRLHSSRGIENSQVKSLMRMSALLCDGVFLMPAFLLCLKELYPYRSWSVVSTAWFVLLVCPLFIIIDHGHFQYNSVSMGISLLSFLCFFRKKLMLGTVLLMLAVFYKQMALYFALPMFCFVVGTLYQRTLQEWNRQPNVCDICDVSDSDSIIKSKKKSDRHWKDFDCKEKFQILSLVIFKCLPFVIVVIITTLLVFSPWLRCDIDDGRIPLLSPDSRMKDVITRMFPFNRGLFEDKLANWWCTSNIIFKWRESFTEQTLKISCMIAILFFSSPCLVMLISHPSQKHLLYALSQVAMCFYWLSYQVHEKNIMFALLPVSLLVLENPFLLTGLFHLATFSMVPLIQRDGLMYFYWLLQFVFCLLCSNMKPVRQHTQLANAVIGYGVDPITAGALARRETDQELQSKKQELDADDDSHSSSSLAIRGRRSGSVADIQAFMNRMRKDSDSGDSSYTSDCSATTDESTASEDMFSSNAEDSSVEGESEESESHSDHHYSGEHSSTVFDEMSSVLTCGGSRRRYHSQFGSNSVSEDQMIDTWERPDPIESYPYYWLTMPVISSFLFAVSQVEFSQKFPDIGTYLILIYCSGHFVLAWLMILTQHFCEWIGTSVEFDERSLKPKKE